MVFYAELDLKELVKRPCSDSDVTATAHLDNEEKFKLSKACDGNTNTFYHSKQVDSSERHSPFFTIQLPESNFKIRRVTVVNVHTGLYCISLPRQCTERIKGAKVEVLTTG